MKKFLGNLFSSGKGAKNSDEIKSPSLDLNIARLSQKPRQLDTNPANLRQHLDQFIRTRSQQILEAEEYLVKINKVELKSAVRANLLNTTFETTSDSIMYFYRKYLGKGTSFPESEERKTELTAAINLLRQLITSSKIIFSSEYSSSKSLHRDNAFLKSSAAYILQLTIWLQRFLAIRFQSLAPNEWHDLNLIYFTSVDVFNPDKPLDLIEHLELNKASSIIAAEHHHLSLNELYKSIQIFGLLDITGWPSSATQSIEWFLDKHRSVIKVHLNSDCPGDDCAAVIGSQSSAAKLGPQSKEKPGCYFDLTELKIIIRDTIKQNEKRKFIGEDEKQRLQPKGHIEELTSNQSYLALLEKCLTSRQRQSDRKSLYGARTINIYTGLSESYRVLYEHKYPPDPRDKNSGLHDAAARSSSLLFDESHTEDECRWVVINVSENGYLIRTRETRYMHAMEVGQVVTLRGEEEQGKAPSLGYITRLHRVNSEELDMAVVKISSNAEAVTVLEPGQDLDSQDKLPGILLQTADEHWNIILPRYVEFLTGTPAVIDKKTEKIPVRLGESVETKDGFVMFRVRSPMLSS